MSQNYNGFPLGSPAAGDRTLLRSELDRGKMHKRMVGIKEHQNTRITKERRRSAQVCERDVVRLELENWCLHPPNGHDYRFRATSREVTRCPLHRFTIQHLSSEISGTQRRDISALLKSSSFTEISKNDIGKGSRVSIFGALQRSWMR